jgi:hypothetical protein
MHSIPLLAQVQIAFTGGSVEEHGMRDEDNFGARCDSAFDRIVDLLQALWRRRVFHLFQNDLFTQFTLFDRRDHARIVLRGSEHLVARLQVEAEQAVLEGFRRVTNDSDLLRITSEDAGKPRADILALRFQDRHGERNVLLLQYWAKVSNVREEGTPPV